MASLNSTGPFDFGGFFLFLGGAIELLTTFVAIPLSIVNLCVVARASVIHLNMKAILIFQSVVLLVRTGCRFIVCLYKFILWDSIGAEKMQFFPLLIPVYFVSVYGRNFVAHVLIVERILATLFVQSYENYRGCMFTILWMPFTLAFSIYLAFFTPPADNERPLVSLITIVMQMVIGAIELVMFIKLSHYNVKIYQQKQPIKRAHSLSLRYQLSENIRIGKQLIPPLSLNLCCVICSTIIILWGNLHLPYYYHMYNLLINLSSVFGIMIELFIITCHPFLKRDFIQIWHRFGIMFGNYCRPLFPDNRRISDHQTATVACDRIASRKPCPPANVVGIAQRDLISGMSLTDQQKPEDHFAMLKQAWEKKNSI